jgi:hypothetical protein
MKLAAGEQSKSTAPAMSLGSPHLPTGTTLSDDKVRAFRVQALLLFRKLTR